MSRWSNVANPTLVNHLHPTRAEAHPARQRWAAVSTAVLVTSLSTIAFARGDAASLERGARPDTTPQQRYQTAIREAGGGLKVSLEECRAMAATARKGCESTARARYRADMEEAKRMLRDPAARPVNIVGEPIRSTETTYVVKP
jgi:hypothetical protein